MSVSNFGFKGFILPKKGQIRVMKWRFCVRFGWNLEKYLEFLVETQAGKMTHSPAFILSKTVIAHLLKSKVLCKMLRKQIWSLVYLLFSFLSPAQNVGGTAQNVGKKDAQYDQFFDAQKLPVLCKTELHSSLGSVT